jgi:CRP-like cAMP-binding protein
VDGKVASLTAMRVFDGWTSTEVRRLARAADLVDVGAGEKLVRTGAWHAGCYLLLSGALVTTTPEGSRLITAAGEFVGLPETLTGVTARGDSVAMRASTVLAFTAQAFFVAVDEIRSLRTLALQELAVAQVAPRLAGPVAPVLAMAPTS